MDNGQRYNLLTSTHEITKYRKGSGTKFNACKIVSATVFVL